MLHVAACLPLYVYPFLTMQHAGGTHMHATNTTRATRTALAMLATPPLCRHRPIGSNSLRLSPPPLLRRGYVAGRRGSRRAASSTAASAATAMGRGGSRCREAAVARMPRLAHREVMLALAKEAEARLGARLLPSQVPADVAEFGDAAAGALGSVDVRRGAPGSSIDFMLEAWFHRALPGGGAAIDITSLIVFLNGATDAPHFLLELIQGGPASLVILLDLFPRRDLPLHPGYIDRYYGATGVDAHRERLARVPQVRPYVSPSLLVRSLWSPTAVVADVQCGEGEAGAAALEGIVRGPVASSAAAVLDVWLERCAAGGAAVEEMAAAERERLVARDRMIATTSVELNLSANLPKMFDADVSGRVVAEIAKAFSGSS
ncbi:hypothetical protein ACP4OV_010779 [Aristida adscensionis]